MLTRRASQTLFSLFTIILATSFSFMSCGHREMDSKQVATVLNQPKSDITKERDEKFLVNAAEINFEQIMLGKLALQRSVSEDIKALANMLEDKYHSANSEVHSMAITKSIAVPTAATKKVMDDYDQLNLKTNKEFDQEYCSMIIQEHQDAISAFESYTKGNCDEDIKIWAMGMIPELRIHLEKAMELQSVIKNPVSELITEGKRVRG